MIYCRMMKATGKRETVLACGTHAKPWKLIFFFILNEECIMGCVAVWSQTNLNMKGVGVVFVGCPLQ